MFNEKLMRKKYSSHVWFWCCFIKILVAKWSLVKFFLFWLIDWGVSINISLIHWWGSSVLVRWLWLTNHTTGINKTPPNNQKENGISLPTSKHERTCIAISERVHSVWILPVVCEWALPQVLFCGFLFRGDIFIDYFRFFVGLLCCAQTISCDITYGKVWNVQKKIIGNWICKRYIITSGLWYQLRNGIQKCGITFFFVKINSNCKNWIQFWNYVFFSRVRLVTIISSYIYLKKKIQ